MPAVVSPVSSTISPQGGDEVGPAFVPFQLSDEMCTLSSLALAAHTRLLLAEVLLFAM